MRVSRGLLITILVVVLGIQQASRYCQRQDASFCQYTSLSRMSPWWAANGAPVWEREVAGRVERWSAAAHEYEKRVEAWAEPRVQQGWAWSRDVVETHVVPTVYKWSKLAQLKVQLWYNVYVMPRVKHFQYRVQRWVASNTYAQRFLARIQLSLIHI